MAKGESKQYPFRNIGFHLKSLREKENESIPDVSGAVEIESELLIEYEDGLKLPSEDILLLLISHFDLKNEEAMKLWRLAGYDNLTDPAQPSVQEGYGQQSAMFILPIDSRIVYTDQVQAEVNNYGIVINFQQGTSQNQPLTVAKVGMSREHAEKLIDTLQNLVNDNPSKQSKSINKKSENKKQKDKNSWSGSQDS